MIPVKVAGQTCALFGTESLDGDGYRGGKLTREIKRPAAGIVNEMRGYTATRPLHGKKEGPANAGPSLD
jgi:hypothetical protein